MEAELRDARRLASSVEQNLLSPAKKDQMKTLQEKIHELSTIIERDKAEQIRTRCKSEDIAQSIEKIAT
jgi:hypothetical protein